MNQEQKRRMRMEYKKKQQEQFEASLPMPMDLFYALFDFLDEQLGQLGCNHDFCLTELFLKAQDCDPETVLAWMMEHGAGCDCEVLCNIEEQFENL